ncbi:MAG TPA: phosphatase PAP2 family protein [Ignavibacteriales bacterium]|nr:phosphatase PAP2 family protein [Ignavibacteriales bacterium]
MRRISNSAVSLLLFLIWGTTFLNAQDNYTSGISFFRASSGSSLGLSCLSFNDAVSVSSSSVSSSDIRIYSGLGDNIINSFKGNNLYLHLSGIALTALLVTTSSDYYVFKYFNEHPAYGDAARPVIRFAQYFPFVIGGALYAHGKLNSDQEAVAASFAVVQSTALAFVYNSMLKAITGRPHPNWREESDMMSLSKQFRFGFWRGGIFWGWPSGHTSSTMAVVSALTNFYPGKTWLKVLGYGYTAYMMFGVSSLNRGGMHWFSDAVAAAFMSYAIGSTVGKFYRRQFENKALSQAGTSPSMRNFPDFSFSIPL